MEKHQLKQEIQLPPGFRFHPSDEELIVHYLVKKVSKIPLPAAIIAEVELYKLSPWDLPKKAVFGEEEWYFFTPRDRKYPNGMRPNRMAASGYWKATGTDKPILSSCGAKLDDWVLCRVRQKTGMSGGNFWEDINGPNPKEPAVQCPPKLDKNCPNIPMGTRSSTAPVNVEMVGEYLHKDCSMLSFLFNSQNFPCMDHTVSNISFQGNNKTLSHHETPRMETISNISFEGKKTSSSVCGDNFNIDYLQNSIPPPPSSNGLLLQVRKRKIIEGNSEDIISIKHQREEIPQSTSNDTMGTMVSSSTNQMDDRNNSNVDDHQLGSMMMYQDLYSLAFACGE
ncbi:hypothetical protein ACH5RR_004747 [Cinchona calisaya]|uniref:NAC domain-containing protein n=1 Tax=Cinchona calisaya TaxID=153742 RepID=A0ABD3AYW8_9GENT